MTSAAVMEVYHKGIAKPPLVQRAAAVICCLGMFIGSALLLWVWAAPQVNAWLAGNQFSEATSAGYDLNDPTRLAMLEQAEAYNQQMTGNVTLPVTGIKDYEHQLITNADGVMCWVEIPSIEVRLPVYHGDSDETLKRGLGHLDYTSLPVGGIPSHCVITGHSGMPGNYMFDDLELLRPGDLFVLWTLGEPYAYRVYDIDIVVPSDSSTLEIQPGRDLCTLVTCTPYRINTHRLLVHAERTEYDPDAIAAARKNRPLHLDRLLSLLGAIATALAIPLVWALINYGILKWGKNGIALLKFGLNRAVRLDVNGKTAKGRRHKEDGRIIVEFTRGDLLGCMEKLGRPKMAEGATFEAFGSMRKLTLINLTNDGVITFMNHSVIGVDVGDVDWAEAL